MIVVYHTVSNIARANLQAINQVDKKKGRCATVLNAPRKGKMALLNGGLII